MALVWNDEISFRKQFKQRRVSLTIRAGKKWRFLNYLLSWKEDSGVPTSPSSIIEIHGGVSRQEMKNYGTIDQRLPADLFNCFIKSPVVELTTTYGHESKREVCSTENDRFSVIEMLQLRNYQLGSPLFFELQAYLVLFHETRAQLDVL